ncbi:hypothetical protein GCM10010358_58470 [Streptomyces minutiscleroticus]|uniref:Uncharacterized protein n=1 Tax=Streptomyces minutiscleroticus TaxID=68238 RepID=A0A918U5Q6_9ACTN|nr:hypothetical protein GCM10010358_58470 [Streptomyces minutiscleroticus]
MNGDANVRVAPADAVYGFDLIRARSAPGRMPAVRFTGNSKRSAARAACGRDGYDDRRDRNGDRYGEVVQRHDQRMPMAESRSTRSGDSDAARER